MSSDPIRAFRDEDIPAVARIWRELRPDAMHNERNAPMLAVDRRLGYEPFTARRGYLKEG